MNPVELLLSRIESNGLWEKPIELSRGEFLKSQGTVDTNIYFVEEGCLRVFVMDGDEEQTIRFGYQNNIIASLDSYISGKPSDFFIQALKKTCVKAVSKSNYESLIENDPELFKAWRIIMEQLILQMMERERDLLTNSPQERYERVLKRSPQLFQEVPSKYIASYLRMTPETLSRLKKY